jgi:hypothetical protein
VETHSVGSHTAPFVSPGVVRHKPYHVGLLLSGLALLKWNRADVSRPGHFPVRRLATTRAGAGVSLYRRQERGPRHPVGEHRFAPRPGSREACAGTARPPRTTRSGSATTLLMPSRTVSVSRACPQGQHTNRRYSSRPSITGMNTSQHHHVGQRRRKRDPSVRCFAGTRLGWTATPGRSEPRQRWAAYTFSGPHGTIGVW